MLSHSFKYDANPIVNLCVNCSIYTTTQPYSILIHIQILIKKTLHRGQFQQWKEMSAFVNQSVQCAHSLYSFT